MYVVLREQGETSKVVGVSPYEKGAKALAERAMQLDKGSYVCYALVWAGCNTLVENTEPCPVLWRLHRINAQATGRTKVEWCQWGKLGDVPWAPTTEFAYKLLSGDPTAIDVWQDVVAGGRGGGG